ncbi:MAG: NAD(P)H-dependent oxidoreductase subunit E, partial [Betaproteobacteria bacterium]
MGGSDEKTRAPERAAEAGSAAQRSARKRGTPKGRRVDPQALAEVKALLGDAPRRVDLLIEHLHKIQDAYGHLAAAHLAALAEEMRMAMAEVYEVASFYHHFDIVKEGEVAPPALTVRVCDSLSCEMAGAKELLRKLPGLLGKEVRVVAAPCIGRCESAPAVAVGQNCVLEATVEAVSRHVRERLTRCFEPKYIDYAAYRANGGYALIADCMAGKHTQDGLTKVMENSGLRGLGGAGFPAGRKWRLVAAEPAPRNMAVNIDEGEPGTFKDRYYLERDPHRFLEGMLVAAWCADASEIWIYLRDEYAGCRAVLERELAKLREEPPCALPPIHLRRGAGAYICGEESAMIESIEGKRGMPRLRPPYVAQVGLFGRPTLE